MIAKLLARLGLCAHRHTTREDVNGVRSLVCDTCGRTTPMLTWTKAEKAKRQRLQRRLRKPSQVVDIRRKRA